MSSRPSSLRGSIRKLAPFVREFAPYLRRERSLLAGGTLALFAEVGMRLLQPWPLKFVLDGLSGPIGVGAEGGADSIPGPVADPGTLILLCAAAVVGIALVRAVTAYASTVVFALAGNRVLTRVRHALFLHLQGLQGRFHDRARSGDLVVRVIGDVGILKDVMVTALLPLVANVMILVAMLAVMAWMDPRMTLLAVLLFPLLTLRMVRIGGKIRGVARKQRQREGELASTAAEAMGAMHTVQALGLEDRFSGAFADQGSRDMKEGVKAKRLQAGLERSVDVLIAGSTALVLGYGAHRLFQGQITPGELVVFLAYLNYAFKPMKSVAKYTARLSKAAAAAERVMELFTEESEVRERPGARPAPSFRGELRFEEVSFAYPDGEKVLDHLDLHLHPGERVALVGPSGTGKSTLASLLLRLRDPQSGRILFDGEDLREFTLGSVRRQVAVLLQEPVLFATSIRENIACGSGGSEVSEQDLLRAAELARADGFIRRLPGGYDAQVGERGVTLSRGERQRITIARLILRAAPFLILDEPTTGLDPENQLLVMEALEGLAQGRTTLVITHDLQLAHRMDRVIHLEGGQIRKGEEVRDAVLA